ncbi:MAG: ATP synthase subunit delta [Candidatus Omnitrophica bacterium ADurb.Bin277]|nr:MAG: ATP synthase subunit delta [Candidatus Omnitrophica bacterium ADurb.Bin277]
MKSRTEVGIRYARALFGLAEKSGQLAEIDRWLARFADGIKHYPEVSAMIRNPIISERDKVDFIEKLFSEGTPQLLRNFFRILIEKKRFAILGEVYDVFHAMFEQSRGVTEVELLSALPLSGQLQEKLKHVLSKKLALKENRAQKEIRLFPKTESSLIGGFVLRFDGKEIDCSFRNRFFEIEQQLLAQ